MAYDKDSVIAGDGAEMIGNAANRFDEQRQTTTLGPTPPVQDDGPPETRGTFAPSPKAS